MAVCNNGVVSVDYSRSALAVLPELVWNIILDTLDNSGVCSRDIENLFHAFPDLSMLFHKMKPVWFFDQVFPHLNKYGDPEEKLSFIASCQYVCKRWASVTESFQQNHPSNRAYNHEGLTRRSVPYKEFSYDEVSPSRIYFSSPQKLLNYCDAMKNHPRDPIRHRHVWLENPWETVNVHEFLDAALVFLQMFGKRIKSMFLFPQCDRQDFESSKRILFKILKCLSHLQNGRYLGINFWLDLDEISDTELHEALPQILHFDTIHICIAVPLNIRHSLMSKFAPVKKLIIDRPFPTDCSCLWNLVDLRYRPSENVSAITGFPQLKKLTVVCLSPESPAFDISYLFNLLKSLQLEELELPFSPFRDRGYCTEAIPQFPSLKYLRITDHPDQSLNFLEAFPSLEHLEMDWAVCMSGDENEKTSKTSNYRLAWKRALTLTSTLRCYLYEPVVPRTVNIWNKIPSLKLLTVVASGTLSFKIQFAKECGNKPFYSYIVYKDGGNSSSDGE